MGVTGDAVYQSVDDPNDVTVWHDFETLEAAQEFASSPRLREAMAGAGVAGEPQIWFTTEASQLKNLFAQLAKAGGTWRLAWRSAGARGRLVPEQQRRRTPDCTSLRVKGAARGSPSVRACSGRS